MGNLDRNTCDQCPHKLGLRLHCQQWPFPEFFVLAEKVKVAHHYWYQQSARQPHQLGFAFKAEVAANYYRVTHKDPDALF